MNSRSSSIFWTTLFTSMAILVYEVALTRVFSVILNYHFVFVVISFALLGLGLGSMAQGLWFRGLSRFRTLRLWLFIAGAFSFPVSGVLLVSLPLTAGVDFSHLGFYIYLGIATVPFMFAGINLAWIFQTWTDRAAVLYAGDLIGAAIGAVGAWFLLEHVSGLGAVMGSGMVAGIGVLIFTLGRHITPIRGVAVLLGTGVLFLGSFLTIVPEIPIGQDTDKDLYRMGKSGLSPEIVDSRWSAFGRTDLVKDSHSPHELALYVDGAAGTPMIHVDSTMNQKTKLQIISRWALQYFPYSFLPENEKESAYIIGPGGGKDVLIARSTGVKQITAVEVNPDMVELVRDHSDFNGGIYAEGDQLDIMIGEGRQVLRNSDSTYDIISLALPITKSRRSYESYALTEDYLFTVEAFQEYFDHMTQEGRVMILAHGETEVLRLVSTALRAFELNGIENTTAMKHFYAVSDGMMALLVIKKQPFTRQEVSNRHQLVEKFQLHKPVAYFPYLEQEQLHMMFPGEQHIETPMFQQAMMDIGTGRFKSEVAFMDYPMDVSPVTDNQPFFYDFKKGLPGTLTILFIIFAILLGLIIYQTKIRISAQFAAVRSGFPGKTFIASVTILGLAFMMGELSLFQKIVPYFRHPSIALTVTLVVLLTGTGIGSWVSQRFRESNLLNTLRIAAVAIGVLFFGFRMIFPLVDTLSMEAGRLVLIAWLFLTGLPLGTPFPTLLRFLHREDRQDIVPYAWGINGVASVTGSVFAVILAKWFGWNFVLVFAGIAYLSLAVVFTRLRNLIPRTLNSDADDAGPLVSKPEADVAEIPLNA
ncbi:MAG: hypothetical protein K9N46_13335 [Candidatus Marinimicrobia bacterium]|nr:hypothetical protein [Candidatus Neomarinimicrobiota bacterium]MCF7829765.1 hypothetical protein [Candidatus Neomarinimicrobiota bacterium]MCF7881715.1 hypothetical protein [Candidatus Neomarinimicrobiota bacterium]